MPSICKKMCSTSHWHGMMRRNAALKVTHMSKALTIFVTLALAGAAAAHPLEDAAHDAMALCARVDGVETIDQCMRTTSQSEHRPPARAALQRLFKARTAFMRDCDTGSGLVRCQEQADLYVWGGTMRDFRWTVEHLDRPAPQ
jgi:hypothetical protein